MIVNCIGTAFRRMRRRHRYHISCRGSGPEFFTRAPDTCREDTAGNARPVLLTAWRKTHSHTRYRRIRALTEPLARIAIPASPRRLLRNHAAGLLYGRGPSIPPILFALLPPTCDTVRTHIGYEATTCGAENRQGRGRRVCEWELKEFVAEMALERVGKSNWPAPGIKVRASRLP
jgi:hypothetical protein